MAMEVHDARSIGSMRTFNLAVSSLQFVPFFLPRLYKIVTPTHNIFMAPRPEL